MIFKMFSIQTRPSREQPYYWEVRPFGNPHPAHAKQSAGFLGIIFVDSDDGLTRTVQTFWKSRQDWLNTMPPDVFEQPQFSQWLAERNMTFTAVESEVDSVPAEASL